MTLLPPGAKVHLAFGYIDMRKGIDGLAMLVQGVLRAHARHKFYDLHEATGSPIAAEALRRIAELYAIEGPHRRGASARALHQRPATHRDDEALA